MAKWQRWQRLLGMMGLLGLLLGALPSAGMAETNGWEDPSNVSNSSTLTRYAAVSSSAAWDAPVVTYLEDENPNDPNDLTLKARVKNQNGTWTSPTTIMEAQFLSDQEVMQLLQSSGEVGVLDVYAGVSYWQPRQASDSSGKIHVVVSPRSGDNNNASAVKYLRIVNSGGIPQKNLGPITLSSNTGKHAGFAQIAVNPDNNNIYVAYLQYDGPVGYVVRSTNGGNNWSSPITVAGGIQGYAGITVQAAGGKVVVAWGDGNRRVKAKVVDESSFTQSAFNAAQVLDLSSGTTGCTGISSAVSPSGRIYVACMMRRDTVAESYISVSRFDPYSNQWVTDVHASQGNRSVHRAVVAVDDSDTIWLAWDKDSDNRELMATAGHINGNSWVQDVAVHPVRGRGEFPIAYFGPRFGERGVHLVAMGSENNGDVFYTFRRTSCTTASGSFNFQDEKSWGSSSYTPNGPTNGLQVRWCGGPPNPTQKMKFQVDGGAWGSQVDVTTPYTVTLGNDGQHTVVAEFATVTTPTTQLVTRTVYVDTQPPVMDSLTISKGTGGSSNPKDVLAQDGTYISTRYGKVRVTFDYHDVPKDGYQSDPGAVWATHGDPNGSPQWRKWWSSSSTPTRTVENNWNLFAYEGSGVNVLRTISAKVLDKAGNPSNVVTGTIFIDKKPPTGTLTICSQDGSTCGITSTNTTTVTLKLDAFDNAAAYANSLGKPKVAKFRLRNSGEQWTDWMWYDDSYATTGYKWRVAPFKSGSRTVQVQFMDYAGYTSSTYSKRIYLDPSLVDSIRPTGSVTIYDQANASQLSPLGVSNMATVTLRLTPTDNYSSEPGLPKVRYFRLRNAGGRWTGWLPYNDSYSTSGYQWRLQQGTSGGRWVYVQYMDWAGNLSTFSVNTAVFSDTTAPQVSVLLDGGASTTADRKVDVTFVITDANPIIKAQIANGDQDMPKWSFTTRTLNPDDPKILGWTLTSGAGQKYVWVKVQDWALNWSPWVSQTITYTP